MSGGDLEMFAYRNVENLLGLKAARLTQGQQIQQSNRISSKAINAVLEADITKCHGTPNADVLLPSSRVGTTQLLLFPTVRIVSQFTRSLNSALGTMFTLTKSLLNLFG